MLGPVRPSRDPYDAAALAEETINVMLDVAGRWNIDAGDTAALMPLDLVARLAAYGRAPVSITLAVLGRAAASPALRQADRRGAPSRAGGAGIGESHPGDEVGADRPGGGSGNVDHNREIEEIARPRRSIRRGKRGLDGERVALTAEEIAELIAPAATPCTPWLKPLAGYGPRAGLMLELHRKYG